MASSRGNPQLGDVLRSIGVLGLAVLVLYGIGQFFSSTPEQVTRTVDWKPAAESARRSADYPVLAPQELPDGFRATSARFTPETGRWTLGILSEDDAYLGIEQTRSSVRSVLERVADGSAPAGSAKVADLVWEVHTGPDERITYVTRVDDVTTVVTGTVDQDTLERYIEALR